MDVPVVAHDVCNASYRAMYRDAGGIAPGMLCAGYMVDGGKDTCQAERIDTRRYDSNES